MNQPTRPPDGPAAPVAAPLVLCRRRDAVAILSLDGPDGNRLGPALITALQAAFSEALADPSVTAIVLAAEGRDFCAGAFDDLSPPGPEPMTAPPGLAALASLCTAIADSPKPVACALRGRVAAGGLALALAASVRVATDRCVFLSPELRAGRLPAGNAAVRLAWQIGAGPALALLKGAPMPATEALSLGLIDAIEADPVEAAVARVSASAPKARPGLADGAGFAAAFRRARAALPAPLPPQRQAEGWLIDSVEAAQLLPPEQALAYDLIRAQDAARLPAARALAHQARAARRAFEPAPQPVEGAVAVALGRETAAQLVPVMLREGARVVLLGSDREALSATLAAVAEAQMALLRAGRLTQPEAGADWARLSGRLALDPASPPGVALAEAPYLGWLEAQVPPGVPLAWWAGSGVLAEGLADPARVVPLVTAPTRPARLCEVVTREGVAEGTVRAVAALVLQIRLSPLVTHEAAVLPGLLQAVARAAAWLAGAGIGGAALAAGGLVPEALRGIAAEGPPTNLPLEPDRLVLLAVVNAGLRLLQEGSVARPSDLDLAMVLGAGWPAWRGGPMAEADQLGPMVLRHELRIAAGLDEAIWGPVPMLDEMIRQGWRFEDLNGE